MNTTNSVQNIQDTPIHARLCLCILALEARRTALGRHRGTATAGAEGGGRGRGTGGGRTHSAHVCTRCEHEWVSEWVGG